MEFAALATRVDVRRQVTYERRVELASDELSIENTGVDAREPRLQAGSDHLAGEPRRVQSEQWKQRGEAAPHQLLFPVAPDVLEEQIAERDMSEPLRGRL